MSSHDGILSSHLLCAHYFVSSITSHMLIILQFRTYKKASRCARAHLSRLHQYAEWASLKWRAAVTGRFAPLTFRPLDVSPLGRFAPRTFRPLDVSPTHWTFRPRLCTFRSRLLFYVFVVFLLERDGRVDRQNCYQYLASVWWHAIKNENENYYRTFSANENRKILATILCH